jgi:ABC-2 type transport system permease protein
VVVLGGTALALGWDPVVTGASVLGALLVGVLGTAAFAAIGLLVAGTLRAEATLAAANLVYLLLMAGGAVVLPASAYGGFGEVAQWLPSGALGEGMRAALVDGAVDVTSLLALAGWALVGTVLTARTFQWE